MMIETPRLNDETDAARHFTSLAAAIEKGAAYLEREAEEADRDGKADRAQAKRNGAAAARAYATHVATEWNRQSWANLSEDAQVYAHACNMSGILMDPINAITREEDQAAKGYSALSGPQIDVEAAKAKRALYLRAWCSPAGSSTSTKRSTASSSCRSSRSPATTRPAADPGQEVSLPPEMGGAPTPQDWNTIMTVQTTETAEAPAEREYTPPFASLNLNPDPDSHGEYQLMMWDDICGLFMRDTAMPPASGESYEDRDAARVVCGLTPAEFATWYAQWLDLMMLAASRPRWVSDDDEDEDRALTTERGAVITLELGFREWEEENEDYDEDDEDDEPTYTLREPDTFTITMTATSKDTGIERTAVMELDITQAREVFTELTGAVAFTARRRTQALDALETRRS